jgi:hypothetical protein
VEKTQENLSQGDDYQITTGKLTNVVHKYFSEGN